MNHLFIFLKNKSAISFCAVPNYLLFFLLVLWGPVLMFAQNYTPIIINGGVFFKTELLTSEGLIPAEITVANFEKIEGQLYNRVFFKRGLEADMLIGYFREDPGTGQLRYRPLTGDADILVYDISLELGDAMELPARWCDGQNNDIAEVIAVNEVDGLRELVFDRQVGEGELCQPLTFLEGVGPSATLMFPYFQDAVIQNGVAQRICHASHEAVIYYPGNVEVDLCGFATVNTRDVDPVSLHVFPNPAQEYITISGVEAGGQLNVFSITGQLLYRLPATGKLDCSSWSDGMYILQLISRNGDIQIGRVLKN
jgi:hypothetical protein